MLFTSHRSSIFNEKIQISNRILRDEHVNISLFCLFNDLFILFPSTSSYNPLSIHEPSFIASHVQLFIIIRKNSWNMFDELSDFRLIGDYFASYTHFMFELLIIFKGFFLIKEEKVKTLSQYKNLNCRKIDFLFVFLD